MSKNLIYAYRHNFKDSSTIRSYKIMNKFAHCGHSVRKSSKLIIAMNNSIL